MRIRLLASLAVAAAALLPATAQAATISVDSLQYASQVDLSWNVTATSTETVWRAPGTCASLPMPLQSEVVTYAGSSGNPPVEADALDTPGDGRWCYYVQDDGLGYGTSDQAIVDTAPPPIPGAPTGTSPVNTAPSITVGTSVDAVSGVNHYDVYRDGSKVNANPIPAGGPLTWSDLVGQSTDPVAQSGDYSYTVVAVDNAGYESDPSNPRVIEADFGAPDPPAAPLGTAHVRTPAITFSASADAPDHGIASGVNHYDVYRQGSKVNASPIPAVGPLAWSDVVGQSSAPVATSGSYAYTIVAVDSAGNESAESPPLVIDVDRDAPVAPVPTGTTPVSTAPAITFGSVTDPTVGGVTSSIDHYDVYRGGVKVNASPITGGGTHAWSDVTGQSLDPVPAASGSYSYTVVVVDSVGNQSGPSTAKVIARDVDAPVAPVPTGTTPVSTAPAISFGSVTDPTVNGVTSGIGHYDVYRGGVKVNASPITGGGTHAWSDVTGQSLDPVVAGSGSYSYTVVVVDGAGNASAASAAKVIARDSDAPTTPLAPVGTTPTSLAPVITFAASSDPTVNGVTSGIGHYDIYRGGTKINVSPIASGGPYTWSDVAGQSSSPATGSVNYSYTVVAVDLAGNPSAQSAPFVIMLDTTAPTAISVAPIGQTPVSSAPTITFNATTDPVVTGVSSLVDHYDVYRDGTKVNAAPILENGAPTYDWSDGGATTLSPPTGGAHDYTVKAVDKAGNVSGASPPRTILLDPSGASAPTSVAALAAQTTQRPQISWAAPATPPFTVDHYKIYRGGVFLTNVTGTTFTDTTSVTPTLADGNYTYQVRAVDQLETAGGTGTVSAPVVVMYDTKAPDAPAGVSATARLDGAIDISWTASSDGTGSGTSRYVVRRSQSSSAPSSIADGDSTCQITATSCVDATALNGKLYSYAVFAVDAVGNTSPAGVAQSVTARDQTPPAVPSGLTATPGDGSVSLSWTPAAADDDVAGYALVAKQGTGAPTSDSDGLRVCTAIVGTSSSCAAAGLTNGAAYTFGLFALDEAFNRSQPAVVRSTPNGKVVDTQAPAAASKLKIKIAGNKVTLTWKNPADRDFDHVVITSSSVKPSANKAGARVYSGKGTKTTTKVAPGQSRWFVVVAYDAVGNASAPASIQAVVKVASPFGPAPKAKVHGKVRLSWPTVKGARYYNVQIFAGKQRVAVGWPAGHSLVVPHAKLHKGVKYTWYVWPGLGAKAKAHYGKLIGKNVFTYAG